MEHRASSTKFLLLYLLPDQDETAPLEMTSHIFDLDKDAPPYDVLLYNWGTSEELEIVLCSHTEMAISQEVANALKAIRSRKSGLRYIWVDSICINRVQNSERIRQIQLMPRIKKTAETRILWMGADDEHTPAVFELMESLISARKSVILPTSRFAPKPIPLSLAHAYRRILPRPPTEKWRWLDDFFDRRANPFCCAWIAADITLTRPMSMMCGNFMLPWAALCDGLEAYAHLSDVNNIRSPVFYTMLGLYTLREETDVGMTVSWGRLLEVVRALPFTDARHKIYASVSWPEERTYEISEARSFFSTGYTAGTLDTYLNTAKFLINQSPNEPFLSVLSMKEDHVITYRKEKYSSWVPDWRRQHTVYRLNSDANPFSASGCTSPYYVSGSEVLVLRGCIVDEVAAVGPYLPSRCPHDKFNLRGTNNIIFAEWYEWAKSRAQPGRERNEVILHWAETVQAVGRHIPSYMAVEMENSAGLLELAKSWLDYLETEGEEETEQLRKFYANCLPAHGRRFGITRRGRFCLLPKNTAEGDWICVPYGSKVPFVFRGDAWFKSLGECYIHGAMFGEALDWDNIIDAEFALV